MSIFNEVKKKARFVCHFYFRNDPFEKFDPSEFVLFCEFYGTFDPRHRHYIFFIFHIYVQLVNSTER